MKLAITAFLVLTYTFLGVSLIAQVDSTQSSKDTLESNNLASYLSLLQEFGITPMDSVAITTQSAASVEDKVLKSRITPNGYIADNGVLYTMRIKIPEDNHAAIRQYDWSTQLDTIDQQMIYPSVKKK